MSRRPCLFPNTTHSPPTLLVLYFNRWTRTDTDNSEHIYVHLLGHLFRRSQSLQVSTFLRNPSISLVRVRNSEIHPHPPVKVVKPDWGHPTLNAASSEPNLRATWLGHAVRRSSTRSGALLSIQYHFSPRASEFSSSFRVLAQAQMKSRPASCLTPSSQTASALCHG